MSNTLSDWDEGALLTGVPTGRRVDRAPYLEQQQALGFLAQGGSSPLMRGIKGFPFFTVSTGPTSTSGCNYGSDNGGAAAAVAAAQASTTTKVVWLEHDVSYAGLVIPATVTVLQDNGAGGLWVIGAGGLTAPIIVQKGKAAGQSSGVSVFSYPTLKVAGSYFILCHLDITALSGNASMTGHATWQDESGSSGSDDLTFYKAGATTLDITPSTLAKYRGLLFELDTDDSGTAIALTTTVTPGSGGLTYNVSASLWQLTDANGD
jgi:hypothetical protein